MVAKRMTKRTAPKRTTKVERRRRGAKRTTYSNTANPDTHRCIETVEKLTQREEEDEETTIATPALEHRLLVFLLAADENLQRTPESSAKDDRLLPVSLTYPLPCNFERKFRRNPVNRAL